jgi:hypothetical protein
MTSSILISQVVGYVSQTRTEMKSHHTQLEEQTKQNSEADTAKSH